MWPVRKLRTYAQLLLSCCGTLGGGLGFGRNMDEETPDFYSVSPTYQAMDIRHPAFCTLASNDLSLSVREL
jgi:hypothetical protein